MTIFLQGAMRDTMENVNRKEYNMIFFPSQYDLQTNRKSMETCFYMFI